MNRYAAIDVGTNTVRLLVADVDGTELLPVARESRITRLGAGVDARGELDSFAIDRTADAVEEYASRARSAGAPVVRVVGTSAVRDASDRARFGDAVRSRTGLDLEVLEGEDEGRLAFLGATTWLPADRGPFLVCDIGGGSTEFVRGTKGAETVWSADIGSVRLRERFLSSDPPTSGEIEGARALVEAELLQVERDVAVLGNETLVAVAGTATTLAALVLGLTVYDRERVHGSRLRAADIEAWTGRLLGMRTEEVRALPTMEAGRADVIAAGALVLREAVRRWSLPEVLVSERDILDGLILDLVLGPDAGLPGVVELVKDP